MDGMLHIAKSLVPPPSGQHTFIKSNFNTADIVAAMKDSDADKAADAQTFQLAPYFVKDTLGNTLHGIHSFIRQNIRYKEDPRGKQLVPDPSPIIHKQIADCKGYARLTSSILKNLGIPCYYRFARYKKSYNPEEYTHVYVVVPWKDGHIVIDPCVEKFNYENKDEWSGDPLDVQVQNIRNFDWSQAAAVNGVGDWFKDRWEDITDFAKRVIEQGKYFFQYPKDALQRSFNYYKGKLSFSNAWSFFKRVFPLTVVSRNGLLLALDINFLNMAGRLRPGLLTDTEAAALKLSPDQYAAAKETVLKVENLFKGVGGNVTDLQNTIKRGGGRKAINKISGGPAIGDGGATLAAITAALPLIATIIQWIRDAQLDKKQANSLSNETGYSSNWGGKALQLAQGIITAYEPNTSKLSLQQQEQFDTFKTAVNGKDATMVAAMADTVINTLKSNKQALTPQAEEALNKYVDFDSKGSADLAGIMPWALGGGLLLFSAAKPKRRRAA